MLRVLTNAKVNKITELLTRMYNGIESAINHYYMIYTSEEIQQLINARDDFLNVLNNLKNGNYNQEEIYRVLRYEDDLKGIIFKSWLYESNDGASFISWHFNDGREKIKPAFSSTFSKDLNDSFCESEYGIEYRVNIDGFLGACEKDASTLIQDRSHQSLFTIGLTEDKKCINSYNLATTLITPIQVFNKNNNDYQSKHNEIILDSRYIQPLHVIYVHDRVKELAEILADEFKIPLKNYSEHKKYR